MKHLEKQFESTPEDLENEYNPFQLSYIQNYNPLYHLFFEIDENNYNRITLNHTYFIKDMHTVIDLDTRRLHNQNVYIKFSPILDSLRFMTGRYGPTLDHIELPKIPSLCIEPDSSDKKKATIHKKLMNPHNASYVDNFFSFLSSQLLHHHGFLHGIDYYGSFLGIQKNFKVNISDDLDYLHSSTFFRENNRRLFHGNMENLEEYMNYGSRRNKTKLVIGGESTDISSLSVVDLGEIETVDPGEPLPIEIEEVYENQLETQSMSSDVSSDNTSNNSEINYSSDEEGGEDDEEWETESEGGESEENSDENSKEEPEKYAYVHNYPVQLICLEKCHGTLDELFDTNRINCFESVSCLFQIVMTLLTYQKAFAFTHNDLHTNNVMYIETTREYLYYRYQSRFYKVPTFGKIYKLIDFGRGVYQYKGRSLFSDSFSPNGDASTQYNTEPYYNAKKPRVEPNMSFDLCRLGTSIYDFVIEDDHIKEEDLDEFQKTIRRWCQDDTGKNVLYKSNGEERYPNFKLYKMIARTVHQHTPEAQLTFPLFQQFCVTETGTEKDIMDIDSIPSYVLEKPTFSPKNL